MVSSTFGRVTGRVSRSWLPVAMAGVALLATGCLDRELKPLNPCLVSGVVDKISVENVDKVDLLFVVDNSGSMKEEQASLRTQFPTLIRTLTTGRRPNGTEFPAVRDLHLGVVSTDMGLPDVPTREQLLCGSEARRFGDDGILRSAGNPGADPGLSCAPSYPAFLQFRLDEANPGANDAAAMQIANDFSCVSSLGTSGCGFEMQLESMLRALWPSDNILTNNMPGMFADNRPFRDGTMNGQGGPGNIMNPPGPNAGFLRNDPRQGLSLIAVIIVSDEEDCSSHTSSHFVPRDFLMPGDPLRDIGLNLRCFNEAARLGANGDTLRDEGQANLFATRRYAQGLKSLRPDNPNLVVFAAIVGVPTNLVSEQVLANVDFSDPVSRTNFYDGLLAQLTEVPDPATLGGMGNPNLTPSCVRTGPGVDAMGNPVVQRAFPPRRFVKVAKEFGENAVIQSICSDDFGPALEQIIDIIAKQLGAVCLPRQLNRDSDGRVACDVVWELPLMDQAPSGTPVRCTDRPFLHPPESTRRQLSENNRPLCVVDQVPVVPCVSGPNCNNNFQPNEVLSLDPMNPRFVDGWYYDNFSTEIESCTGLDKQRIAFTNFNGTNVQPPSGVTVRLECLQEAASLTPARTDVEPTSSSIEAPVPGLGCPDNPTVTTGPAPQPILQAARANQCHVIVTGTQADCATRPFREWDANDGKCYDTQMFCHPEDQVCAPACANDSECQPGFQCDTRQTTIDATMRGVGICVNPTCGD